MVDVPVFISYARSDERYATALMARLRDEPGIAPWQDRIRMSPGDFEDQIKAGIDAAQYLVLVMTPAALRSPWVEKEWRYARESGRCIVPIKPVFDSADADRELDALREQLPLWMQKIQTYDFEGYWPRFVAVLQSPCQATRAPFVATSLPAHFVSRTAESSRIIDVILDDGRRNPSGRTVVLYGAGGFGKTTLALGVCHAPDVMAACDGGILWVTVGQQPQIVTELARIYAALTGERPAFNDQDDAMFAVAKKLDGKRCLFVIDDVWSVHDLTPFLHAAASSSRLITSRLFSVAVSAAADESCRINVGELGDEEAEHLLAAGLPGLAGRPQLNALAGRLNRVPLLLQLANRALAQQLALGESTDAALDWALQQYADFGVVAFDEQDPRERYDAVGKTVEVSLALLGEERRRCLELGVLHEDTDIPFSVLASLWGLKDTQVQPLAQRFHDFGLLKLNLPGRSIRLHDYVREYFEAVLPDRARVHGRLVDAWNRQRQLPAGYPRRHVVFHIVESMADIAQIVPRATQLITLLEDERFQEYQRQHGDATALDFKLTLAIQRASASGAPEAPALIATLALLRKSHAAKARDAALVFQHAAAGHIDDAVARLALFEAEPHWGQLARLLIAWVAPPEKAGQARAHLDGTAAAWDLPPLSTALAWAQQAVGVPPGLRTIELAPDLHLISAILQRAGGAEKLEGLAPLSAADLASGTDATGFIAERDAPLLVAFALRDPGANTTYLEQYIDIHAANRYAHYRNRSLWMLLDAILQFPDRAWVQRLVQRTVTAALNGADVHFEGFVPLAIRGMRARAGDGDDAAALERARDSLVVAALALRPEEGRTDSWSHTHRSAAVLAEVFAVALDRAGEARDLLRLARELPKGFAGFRAASAMTLADSTSIAAPDDTVSRDAALTSATAASHRIQDHRFCLQMTAMVNALGRWSNIPDADLPATIERFVADPQGAEFCAAHRIGEQFPYREEDQHYFQALPIPEQVRQAKTLGDVAAIFECDPQALIAVNGWIAEPDVILTEALRPGDDVNIPNPDFVPILAARFAAAALVSRGLSPEARCHLLQCLVPMALPSATSLDTVMARLLLATLQRPAPLPATLVNFALTAPLVVAGPEDHRRLSVL